MLSAVQARYTEMPRPATHRPRRIHSIRNEGCPTPRTSPDPATSETTVPDETLIALLSAQPLSCKKQIPLFSTQNDEPDSQRFQRRAVCLPTNPAPQNASAPQHRILLFSLQAQLQPVMMQKCITSFFSQEYCFSENPRLSASSGCRSAHSAPSEFFDTGESPPSQTSQRLQIAPGGPMQEELPRNQGSG